MSGAIDYRVSRIVVHCKDCGHDVGLYPARHKCGVAAKESLLNAIPAKNISTQNNNSNNNNSNNISSEEQEPSGKGLWGKLRTVHNWKDVNEGTGTLNLSQPTQPTQPTQGYKLWDKLLSAAAAYKAAEGDSENESEKEDWEGETHISRVLREYYMKKSGDIPRWLYDSKSNSSNKNNSTITSLRDSRRRLVERNENLSSKSITNDISDRGQPKNDDNNRKEQLKVFSSSSDSPLPIPVINRGRENGGYDRLSNRNLNTYTQGGGLSSPDYDSDKYNDRSLTHTRSLLFKDNGRTSEQRFGRGSTERLDEFSRGRELSTNTNINRARSVSPSPSIRAPPLGAYSRYRETGDIRDKNQDLRVPTGRNYKNVF